MLDSLKRKEVAQASRSHDSNGKPLNPFLPYEKSLFVEDISASHMCLLNKFNVVDHHLLLVTREYESQDTWLTNADFEALAHCLQTIHGFGFYNGGRAAGASQHHKHLQYIPLPASEPYADLPIAALIRRHISKAETHQVVPTLPFTHSIRPFAIAASAHPTDWAKELFHHYQHVMASLGLNLNAELPDSPYNLLVTRNWMMGVRRSQPTYEGIAVNSLGFAGWLLVKTPDELARLKRISPLTVLSQVSEPR
jgi:ATP adenylyltransferase